MALLNTDFASSNIYNVTRQPLDYTKSNTTIQTYHGGSIVVNDKVVGRITNWQSNGAYTREGSHCYELNGNTWGLPVDYVPGRATGFNITFTRNEVWSMELELALGYGAVWNSLTDQTYPFNAQEYLFRGATPYRVWTYSGCWFTEKNPTEWSAEGDGKISVSCAMAYVSRKKVK
jgi:hypothetical protein